MALSMETLSTPRLACSSLQVVPSQLQATLTSKVSGAGAASWSSASS